MVPQTVATRARDHGFTHVRVLEPWQHTAIGAVTLTAAPAKHDVPEITYVLRGGGRTVYFGGDTQAIPALRELPEQFGHFDLALLPTNGLCVRPLNDQQVVMNATEAAGLAGVLRPDVAIPHHYAFTSGWLGDRLITRSDPDPRHFAEAARRPSADDRGRSPFILPNGRAVTPNHIIQARPAHLAERQPGPRTGTSASEEGSSCQLRQPAPRLLPDNDAGVASSLVNVGQQVGGSIGLAVVGTVAWSAVASSLRSQAAAAAKAGVHASAAAQTRMYDHALATGFSTGYLVSAGVMVLAVIIALAMIRVIRQDMSGVTPEPAGDTTSPSRSPDLGAA